MKETLVTITSYGSTYTNSSLFSVYSLPSNTLIQSNIRLEQLTIGVPITVESSETHLRVVSTNYPVCSNFVVIPI